MRTVASLFIPVLCLAAAILSLIRLRAEFAPNLIRTESVILNPKILLERGATHGAFSDPAQSSSASSILPNGGAVGGINIGLNETQKSEDLDWVESVSNRILAPASAFVYRANVLAKLASEEPDLRKKIGYSCRALNALGEALRRDPHNSRYLVNWASTRQLIGAAPCTEAFTGGDFKAAIASALAQDPSNGSVLYAGALMYLWSGDRATSFDLLHQVLMLGTGLTPGQERYIFSLIETADDLKAVIPARFPQVVHWISLFNEWDPDRFSQFGDAFGELEVSAINASEQEFKSGAIPGGLHYERLLSLYGFDASEAARQRLDLTLSQLLIRSEQEVAGNLLKVRADLDEIPIVRTAMRSDTRPLKSSLVGWGSNGRVTFNDFYRTIGFFAPLNADIQAIYLTGRSPAVTLPTSTLRVFVSGENDQWLDVTDRCEISQAQIGGKPVALIVPRVEGGSFKFWKLHFNSAERGGDFENSLDRMVRVFGRVFEQSEAPMHEVVK